MLKTPWSITDWERENFLFTYEESERQENQMNRENAKLVYSPEFIPLKPKFLDVFTSKEAIILSFISFYKKNWCWRMYFTNAQLAQIARCSEDIVSKAISKFIKMWYIKVSRKVKSWWWQIRFINEYNETPEWENSRLRKKLSQTKEKHGTNKNKINKNNIYTKYNNIPKEINIPFKENGNYVSNLEKYPIQDVIEAIIDNNAYTCTDVVERKEKNSAKKEKKVRISNQQRTWNWKEKDAIDEIHDEFGISYYDLYTDNYPEKTLHILQFIEEVCNDICIEPEYTSDTVNCFWYCMYGLWINTIEDFTYKFYTDVSDMRDLLDSNYRLNE